jgi:hypothetical protein
MEQILRKSTEREKEVFAYLNDLRESGDTNMFGARPYIIKEFGVTSGEAISLLSSWMKNFNSEGNYEEIKEG